MKFIQYFIRDEVVVHNSQDDIWVIINGRVFDLTKLFEKEEPLSDNLKLLLAYAGKDLSCFFNKDNSPIFRINQYGNSVPNFPPVLIDNWWNDESNIIGHITTLERRVRIINTLSHKTTMINVCEEDTIERIKEKLKIIFKYNTDKFTWRKKCSTDKSNSDHLFMNKTLTENGILYQENENLGLPPAIWLYHKI